MHRLLFHFAMVTCHSLRARPSAMSSEARMRVRQVHRSELRSASPVRSASPGGSPHRLRFFEYAPSGEETAVFRGAKRFPFRRAKLRVRSLLAPLLPAGFPSTVTPDYLPFQARTCGVQYASRGLRRLAAPRSRCTQRA
jgi:hypothetical protein